MPSFKIAHVKDNNVNVIILPLAAHFGSLAESEKSQVIDAFQDRAVAAGLKGRVVPVWADGNAMRFVAPREWHRFFARLSLKTVRAHLNRELELEKSTPAHHEAVDTQPISESVALGGLIDLIDPHERWPTDEERNPPSTITRVMRWVGIIK